MPCWGKRWVSKIHSSPVASSEMNVVGESQLAGMGYKKKKIDG